MDLPSCSPTVGFQTGEAVEIYANPRLFFATIPPHRTAYFHGNLDIFEGLRRGKVVVGEPQAALHTHTLHQLTVSTVKGMCLTVIDALSVM